MKIKITLVNLGLILATAMLASPGYAEQPQKTGGKWRGVASFGLTFGGDKLKEVTVEDIFGDENTENIRAGELFFFSGGGLYEYQNFQIQGTIGYYVDGIFADNGEASFTRFPLELLGFWKIDNFRLGGGVAHHLNPEFEFDNEDDFLPKENVDYEDATGFVIQGEYIISNNFGLGLRYTSIEYELEGNSDIKVDGDSVGFIFSYIF